MHVAIIMDGNGRWAHAKGLPRTEGHRAGVEAVRRTVQTARALGIEVLTLYAFSGDNWGRPPGEVGTLMSLFTAYLSSETQTCVREGIRLEVVGRRDRLASALVRSIEYAEKATAASKRLRLRIAIDYSARHSIRAALESGAPDRLSPDVDLLIRTGGEQRLSDFLLWEAAYAELYFTPAMWPDFGAADLERALQEFSRRERRFGKLPAA